MARYVNIYDDEGDHYFGACIFENRADAEATPHGEKVLVETVRVLSKKEEESMEVKLSELGKQLEVVGTLMNKTADYIFKVCWR